MEGRNLADMLLQLTAEEAATIAFDYERFEIGIELASGRRAH